VSAQVLVALRLGWQPEKLVYKSQKSTKGLRPGDPRYNINSGRYHELSAEATAFAKYLLRDDERVYAAAVTTPQYFKFKAIFKLITLGFNPQHCPANFPHFVLLLFRFRVISRCVSIFLLPYRPRPFKVDAHGRQTRAFPAFKDQVRHFKVAQYALVRTTSASSSEAPEPCPAG
jgi:hypothetical protein